MHRNKDLHTYLVSKAHQLTEEWYNTIDKSTTSGVYSSDVPEVVENLKKQNFEFHQLFCEVFIIDKTTFNKKLDDWVLTIAEDKQHLETPTHNIIQEFMRVRNQYLDFVNEYAQTCNDPNIVEHMRGWEDTIIESFDKAMLRFMELQNEVVERQLQSQQQIIHELSSPLISLNEDTALVPLIGNIDPERAKLILENTLHQCVQKEVSYLFIDLSGVVMIDTMVAHQLFQLIDALELIGVKPILSGLRPEIAQTAVQLGLNFNKLTITSTLDKAITVKSIVNG
ncbi:STAS domain-containing protein [Rossellomorea aquimaris]|uniref:STAS domain-containing protein n=1 Tax=Rossellomorea aquimaris TaxID=189382 RepID=UPI001CD24391|nr:STAS domain-containing protein [Rossellomorea aquimaris]MCA1053672.1 STAS domain-containing protein [Rossellomorea aquimaris]